MVSKLSNAFKVTTKGSYENHHYFINGYNKKRKMIGLLTNDKELAQKHNFINLSDRFIKEVNINSVEEIWEERTSSGLNLLFPKNILEKLKLK